MLLASVANALAASETLPLALAYSSAPLPLALAYSWAPVPLAFAVSANAAEAFSFVFAMASAAWAFNKEGQALFRSHVGRHFFKYLFQHLIANS